MAEKKTETWPLGKLKPAEKNPKLHSPDIAAAIARFGYVTPVVVDERTGKLVAGHGRREALLALKKAGAPPPEGIRVEGKDWLVPVVLWKSKSDAEAAAFLLADNRLTEAGGWNDAVLSKLLAGLVAEGTPLTGLGWDAAALDGLLQGLADVSDLKMDGRPAPATPSQFKEMFDATDVRQMILLYAETDFGEVVDLLAVGREVAHARDNSDLVLKMLRRLFGKSGSVARRKEATS